MNIMVSELYDAPMSAGADEAKARRAAEGFAVSDQEFKKQFSELREDNQKMRTEMADLKGELRHEMQALRGDLSLVKWMIGVLVGLAIAILIRVFFI